MTAFNTTRRVLAIAAAVGCTTGALTVLLQDIMGPPLEMLAHWEIHHTLAVLTVLVVILFAELLWDAIHERLWVSVGGFALVGLMGVGMVLYNSVGNQAAVADTAAGRNAERADLRADLAAAKTKLDKARADIDTATKNGGCGKVCSGLKENLPEYKQAVDDAERKVREKGADEPVGKSAERLAGLIAMFGGDRDKALPFIVALEPILRALLWELGSIFSWGFIRDRRKQPSPEPAAATKATPATDDAKLAELRERFFAPDNDPGPQPSPPGNRRRRKQPSTAATVTTVAPRPSATVIQLPVGNRAQKVSEQEGLAWLRGHMTRDGFLPDQDTMATALDIHKGTVAKWMLKWETEGIVTRTTQGRRKVVRLVEPTPASL